MSRGNCALENYKNKSDEWIILEWIEQNNGAAFEEIYLRKKQNIYNYVFKMTKNATLSEEIVNDTFMVLWEHPKKFQSVNIRTYLIGIARNITLMELRNKITEKHVSIETLELAENISEDFEYREYKDLLVEIVENELPLELREIFYLDIYYEYKDKEIAEIVGKTVYDVKNDIKKIKMFIIMRLKSKISSKNKIT